MSRAPQPVNDTSAVISPKSANGIFGRRKPDLDDSPLGHDGPVSNPAPNGGRKPANPLFELMTPAEIAIFVATNPLMQLAPRGDGRPVIVLPGFLAGDSSTVMLRMLLRQLNHRPVGWGMGQNLGPRAETLEGLYQLLNDQVELNGGPVSIIGWSLGGVYARLVAQEHPHLVEQVVTLGSPFNIGETEPTTISFIWDYLEERGDGFVRDRENVDLDQIPVPSTAVFTKTDGVVSWRSCLQTPNERSENIEVYGAHCGLGFNAAAAYVMADRLAQPRGQWKHFKPPRLVRRVFPKPPTKRR